MLLLWLALASATGGDCPAPVDADAFSAGLDEAAERAKFRDANGFNARWEDLLTDLACLDAVASPELASRVHRFAALHALLSGDDAGTLSAFRAARLAAPDAEAPAWLGEPGSVLELRYTAAAGGTPAPWQMLRIPEGETLYVDGAPATSRPTDRPAFFQSIAEDGHVLWTAWVSEDTPLPESYEQPNDPEVPSRNGALSGRSGADVLDEVAELLGAGAYEDALRLALPATSEYPDLALSFEAAADIATSQLRRQRLGIEGGGGGGVYAARPMAAGGGLGSRDKADRTGLRLGFDLGMPTGLHVQWRFGMKRLDSIDVRFGGNLLLYGLTSVYVAGDTVLAADINIGRGSTWQIEPMVGVVLWGSPYFQLGGALQYDPKGPFQANAGMKFGAYGILPELSVAFLW